MYSVIFKHSRIKIEMIAEMFQGINNICKYSWPLNNTRLNFTGSLIGGFFFNQTQWKDSIRRIQNPYMGGADLSMYGFWYKLELTKGLLYCHILWNSFAKITALHFFFFLIDWNLRELTLPSESPLHSVSLGSYHILPCILTNNTYISTILWSRIMGRMYSLPFIFFGHFLLVPCWVRVTINVNFETFECEWAKQPHDGSMLKE